MQFHLPNALLERTKSLLLLSPMGLPLAAPPLGLVHGPREPEQHAIILDGLIFSFTCLKSSDIPALLKVLAQALPSFSFTS